MDSFPNFPEMWRGLQGRVAELERKTLGLAKAELDANRNAEWQVATLLAGFSNLGGVYAPAAYYKDTFGRIYLRGSITKTSASATTFEIPFVLPSDYRPVFEYRQVNPLLFIQTSGNCVVETTPGTNVFRLDQIQFRTT